MLRNGDEELNEEQKSITLDQYRGIDLSIFFLLVCALELLNIFVFQKYFPEQLFCISIVLPISLLVMQRWNGWAVLIAAGGGIVFCIANKDASAASYLVYGVGNCFVLLNLFWYPLAGKKRFTENVGFRIAFVITGYLFMSIGRALLSVPFEGNFIDNLLAFLSGDALNAAIGLVILLIAGKQKGLFEDQLTYLRRQRDENKTRQSPKEVNDEFIEEEIEEEIEDISQD